jgi:hypothetical protein
VAAAVLLASANRAGAEWMVTGFAGGASTRDSSLALSIPTDGTAVTLSPIHYDSRSFDAPIYYGYRIGFFPNGGPFGVDAELIHLKVYADTARSATARGTVGGGAADGTGPIASIIERFSISHGVNLLLVNAAARWQRGKRSGEEPRWIVTVRFGAGASVPHAESTVGGVTLERYEWGAFAMQGSAGSELRITGPIYALAEYKLTRTVQDVTIAGGSARTPLTTQHLVGGVAVHFGRR